MPFWWYIGNCFQQYVTFSGRANRAEFWYFYVFTLVGGLVAIGIDIAIGSASGIIELIFSIVILLPGLSVTVRRLHDRNLSGWWFLIIFTIIGYIALFIWWCSKGTQGDNRFGSMPP